jgi:hypothetical protein
MYLCSSGFKTLERQIGDPNLCVFEAQGEFLHILCCFHGIFAFFHLSDLYAVVMTENGMNTL